jgi:hypothetical protein
MSPVELFAFESDFVASLRCIPMAVRLKLDRVGVKLTLRQWSRFTRQDRQDLLLAPCEDSVAAAAWRERLVDLIARRAGEAPRPLPEPPCGSWRGPQPPKAVREQAARVNLPPPAADAWAALSELRRFALVKLARDNHDNVNFAPAMREFGLIAPEAPVSPAGPR